MPCLPASALTPCLLALVVAFAPVPSITMCARIIAQVAGTALQAAPPTIVFACVSTHPVFCRDCPAGSCTRGLHWCSPCTVCVCLRHPAQFRGEAWDCIGQPATFFYSYLHLFHEPETAFGQPGSRFHSCLSVCLFVCEQDIAKSYGWIQTKFGGQVWDVTRTK